MKRVLIPVVLCLTGAVLLSTIGTGQAATPLPLPKQVTLKATPKTDVKRPYIFKLTGRLLAPLLKPLFCSPAGFTGKNYCKTATPAQMCNGKVRMTIKRGLKTLARKNVSMRPTCSYSAKITMRKAMKHGKLTISTRWLGNTVLRARNAKSIKVKV